MKFFLIRDSEHPGSARYEIVSKNLCLKPNHISQGPMQQNRPKLLSVNLRLLRQLSITAINCAVAISIYQTVQSILLIHEGLELFD